MWNILAVIQLLRSQRLPICIPICFRYDVFSCTDSGIGASNNNNHYNNNNIFDMVPICVQFKDISLIKSLFAGQLIECYITINPFSLIVHLTARDCK